jgi:hypothetical protein
VCWLFPQKLVRIDTVCLCCGDEMIVAITDGLLAAASPGGIVGYASSELGTPGDFAFK